MAKGKNNNRNNRSQIIIVSVLLVFVLTVSWVAWKNHQNFRDTIIKQWQNQLMTTTRISAANLESYAEKYSENLIVLSNSPLIQERACNRVQTDKYPDFCPLENLYSTHKKDVNAILLLDSTGQVLKRVPEKLGRKTMAGKKCPQGISQMKNVPFNEVTIGGMFVNVINEPSITFSCPVYLDSVFSGAVRWMISVKSISGKYIDSVKVGEDGYMWMMDENDRILSHHDPNFVQLDADIILKDYQITGKVPRVSMKKSKQYLNETVEFFKKLKNNNEGVGNYIDFSHADYSLAVFKKVKFGDRNWTLIMSLPYHEITGPVTKNAIKTVLIAALIASIFIIITIVFFQLQKRRIKLERETEYLAKLAQTNEELKEERNKRLNALIDGQELERKRISRELHDGLGQHLLAIKVRLEQLFDNTGSEINKKLESIRQSFYKTIDETRRISDNLMPVSLEELGLDSALENLCREFENTNDFKIDYVCFGIPEQIDLKTKTHVYRVAQEALANIVKHAEASEVNVQLLGNKEQINLIVQDNGKGFSYDENKTFSGNGISNVRERADILNAMLLIESEKKEGTQISLKITLTDG
jgi:signal transduction histidine kinase